MRQSRAHFCALQVSIAHDAPASSPPEKRTKGGLPPVRTLQSGVSDSAAHLDHDFLREPTVTHSGSGGCNPSTSPRLRAAVSHTVVHIALQNPPSIPSLPVAVLVTMLHGARLVVDWHNYGYTILGLSLGPNHPVVKLAWAIEATFGRLGSDHFCVTHAMRKDLVNWGVSARALHDRPPPAFRPTPLDDLAPLFSGISATSTDFGGGACVDGGTAFTTGSGDLRPTRPALLVSSTSWTPDEDFSILLSALEDYEAARAREPQSLPQLLCVITGKGPLKAFYEEKISKMDFVHVRISTAWLSAADYPKLLGAATLGVSLHTSSSGLDLPMKVVDMFGCALPVCAKSFRCIDELVKVGINGVTFDTASELGEQVGAAVMQPRSSWLTCPVPDRDSSERISTQDPAARQTSQRAQRIPRQQLGTQLDRPSGVDFHFHLKIVQEMRSCVTRAEYIERVHCS